MTLSLFTKRKRSNSLPNFQFISTKHKHKNKQKHTNNNTNTKNKNKNKDITVISPERHSLHHHQHQQQQHPPPIPREPPLQSPIRVAKRIFHQKQSQKGRRKRTIPFLKHLHMNRNFNNSNNHNNNHKCFETQSDFSDPFPSMRTNRSMGTNSNTSMRTRRTTSTRMRSRNDTDVDVNISTRTLRPSFTSTSASASTSKSTSKSIPVSTSTSISVSTRSLSSEQIQIQDVKLQPLQPKLQPLQSLQPQPPPRMDDATSISLDTKKSLTPKAKSRSMFYRSNTQKVNNGRSTGHRNGSGSVSGIKHLHQHEHEHQYGHQHGHQHEHRNEHEHQHSKEGNTFMKQKYELPHSVTFLSLVLPSEGNSINPNSHSHSHSHSHSQGGMMQTSTSCNQNLTHDLNHHEKHDRKNTPSLISISDATTATDILSITSGQTTLAKDRVQETIACSINIHHYLNNNMNYECSSSSSSTTSPKSVQNYTTTTIPPPKRHDGPVNVDFVLESNEMEIASFANLLIESKQLVEVLDIYLTVLNHYQKQFGKYYPFVITTLHNLGVVHVLNGNYKQALYYCKEALKRRQKTLGSNHVDVATSLCELGIIYYAREDFNRGLDVLREALHIACNAGGCNNPDYKVASILNNIGCLHFSMGKLIASIATFEESLDIQRKMMGSTISDEAGCMLLDMSITLCNAGIVSAKHGQSEIASSLVEEGLIVQQSILSDDHRVVKATALTLSRLLDPIGTSSSSESFTVIQELEINLPRQLSNTSQNKINESLSRCADMLTIGSVQHEFNSQQRVSTSMQYKYLAKLILAEGDSKKHCSWVDVSEKSNAHGKDFNLSQVCEQASRYIQQKEITKATEIFHRIRRSRTNKCGDVDLIMASVHHILGLIYLHTQNYQSARVEFQDAAKIRSRQLDADHSDVLASQTKRAITMIALQDFDKALSTFQTLLTHLRKRFGYTHFGVAIILNNIGICHYEFGGLLSALKSFEEAVEILRDAIKKCQEGSDEMNHLLILLGRSLNNLSFIRFKRKEYAEAVVALEEGLKVQRDTFGKNHKLVKSTIENLGFMMATANCFDNKDKLDHMAKMYVEMLGQ